MTTPSTVNNSLEQLTELREALYSLLPVDNKGYNSGTSKWRRYVGQGGVRAEGGVLSHWVGHLHGTWKLSKPVIFGGLVKVSLYSRDN